MSDCRLFLEARKPELLGIGRVLDPLFEEEGVPTAIHEDEQAPGRWVWSVYVALDQAQEIESRIRDRLGADAFGLTIEREALGDVDWISRTLRALAPVRAGRFVVHGSHDRQAGRSARHAIEIDAGQAFGTGHHGTTAGCLDLFEQVLRKGAPTKILDVGTGSGVLAIAAARALPCRVLATDIDPIATKVARRNCVLNGVSARITTETGTGFHHRAFQSFGKAELVFANILARPLQALAPAMARHVAPGGIIILSGLLPHQKTRIIATYRGQGFRLERALIRDGWLSLLMRA